MNGRYLPFGNSRSPLAQALSLVGLAVVLVGAVIMGVFVLMAVLGFAVIAVLGFSLRNWWLRRQARGRGPTDGGSGPGGPARGIRYIEGEFEVIDADADAERRRSDERR
ncbi:MAG TPA: hypothetical protein VGL98_02520 [Gammaproteobacteria bacterium]